MTEQRRTRSHRRGHLSALIASGFRLELPTEPLSESRRVASVGLITAPVPRFSYCHFPQLVIECKLPVNPDLLVSLAQSS